MRHSEVRRREVCSAARLLSIMAGLWLLALSPARLAAAEDGFTITAIEIQGTWRTEKDMVMLELEQVGVSVDSPLTPDIASRAISALYKTGAFTDVALYYDVDPSCNRCVKLQIRLKELPAIRTISYEGLDELDEDDIKEVMDIKVNEVVDEARIRRVEAKIENLYMEKGFNMARVTHRVTPAPKNQVDLVFVMNERGKIYVKEVVIIGNEKVSDKKLKANLALRPGDALTWLTDFGILREQYLEHDVFMLEKYYQDNGYAKAKVDRPQIYLSADERFITIVFTVTEGDQYKFSGLNFQGDMVCRDWWPEELPCTTDVNKEDLVFGVNDLRKRSRLKNGAPFNRTTFLEDLQIMTDLFMDQGYAYANLNAIPIFDEGAKTISIFIPMQRNQKVYVERIDIEGNTKTRDKVIRRELAIAEGDLFSSTRVRRSKQRVFRLGYFETAEIEQERGSAEDRIVLRVTVKERSTGTFQLGFGFSSLESFLFQAQVSQENFLGRGQSLTLSAQISSKNRQFMLRFYEPYLFDSLWTSSISLYNYQTYYNSQGDFGSFDKLSQGGELRFGYPVLDDLYLIGGWRLSREDVTSDTDFHAHLFRDGFTSAFTSSVMYDSRDNRLYPTSGMYHQLSFDVADDFTGSSIEYGRVTLNNQIYFPIYWKLVLKINMEWGWVFSLEESPNADKAGGDRDVPLVPISERYLLGGIYSIRGYDFGTISPKTEVILQDDPTRYSSQYRIGGTKKFVTNVELEFPIFEQAGLKWLFFFDMGNTWSEAEQWFYVGQPGRNEYNLPGGMYYSWGFGFRWYSPMGPLRFEWGIPITPRPGDSNIAFQFSIGNPF